MIDQHELEMRNLRDVMYAMELRFNERETEALQEFQGLIDELKNKVTSAREALKRDVGLLVLLQSLEENHALSAQRKAILDELWEELQKACILLLLSRSYSKTFSNLFCRKPGSTSKTLRKRRSNLNN